ncbi:MAG: phage protease [Shewanella sp.]
MQVKALTALCFNMMAMEATAPGLWLPMIPAGTFQGVDGRTWSNPNPDGIVAAFTKKRPFDVEHATHIKAPKGEEAPASGWITKVENRAGEIWGFVKWNAEGRELIEEEKYAFYSPAFAHDSDTGVIYSLESAGLTNSPNLNVPALNRQEDDPMKLPKLLTDLLGLGEDATAEQAVVAINAIKQDKEVALNSAKQVDLNLYVPTNTYQLALNRAETAEAKLADIAKAEIEALVQGGVDAGKVAPKDKEMYLGLCSTQTGIEQFKAFLGTAPVIATNAQKKVPTNPQQQGDGELTADELALCRAMNVTPEAWAKSRHHKPTY